MAKRSKSSRRWLEEYRNDPYVKEAERLGYRCRAVFKIEEIQQRDKIIKPGMSVVDLGAAPGGWSQMCARWVGRKGQIIALDRLEIEPLEGVTFLQGDFTSDEVLAELESITPQGQVDVVLSDLAPNMSGIVGVDQPKIMYLVELALDFACKVLRPGGHFVAKLFHGEGFDDYVKQCRQSFDKVVIRKPKSSRDRSREVYLVAKGFHSSD